MTMKIVVINWRLKHVLLFPNGLPDNRRSDNLSPFLFSGFYNMLVEEGEELFLNRGSKSAK